MVLQRLLTTPFVTTLTLTASKTKCLLTCTKRCFGKYSRLLDLGGAPSSLNDTTTKHNNSATLNLNKNCHLQYVIFDFQVLCRSLLEQDQNKNNNTDTCPATPSATSASSLDTAVTRSNSSIQPDIDRIQQVASLLKIDLATGGTSIKGKTINDDDDDLSLLTTGVRQEQHHEPNTKPDDSPTKNNHHSTYSSNNTSNSTSDILRHKYAEKLKRKLGATALPTDGTSGITADERTGDAKFLFSARAQAMASSSSASSSTSTRWMAGTGTGQLLSFLHSRSCKVVLLPTPAEQQQDVPTVIQIAEAQSMEELVQQLQSKLSFHLVIRQDGSWTIDRIFQQALADTVTMRDRCLCVSDRDTILRGAKDAGMLTLRIRPPNARRGNISAHYTVETIMETQTIVNEINGISFSTVFKQQGY